MGSLCSAIVRHIVPICSVSGAIDASLSLSSGPGRQRAAGLRWGARDDPFAGRSSAPLGCKPRVHRPSDGRENAKRPRPAPEGRSEPAGLAAGSGAPGGDVGGERGSWRSGGFFELYMFYLTIRAGGQRPASRGCGLAACDDQAYGKGRDAPIVGVRGGVRVDELDPLRTGVARVVRVTRW